MASLTQRAWHRAPSCARFGRLVFRRRIPGQARPTIGPPLKGVTNRVVRGTGAKIRWRHPGQSGSASNWRTQARSQQPRAGLLRRKASNRSLGDSIIPKPSRRLARKRRRYLRVLLHNLEHPDDVWYERQRLAKARVSAALVPHLRHAFAARGDALLRMISDPAKSTSS